MPKLSGWMLWGIVAGLIGAQMVLTLMMVHRESLTFDEGNHMFAGYMMWHTEDYGLNPEHPPFVKLLATAPLLGRALWVPELKGRDFKTEAYLDGRDWLARNDGDRNQLVFEMRMAAGLLAGALSLVVFLAARESFGDWAAIFALTLAAFDPNVLAHSALVTTDIGVSLFFLASTWCFYRYVKHPTAKRLVVAGVVAGLLLATKHSGVMLAPILVLLIAREIAAAEKGTRAREALRLAGAFCGIFLIGVLVLWSFYGFRYAARPAGLTDEHDARGLCGAARAARFVDHQSCGPAASAAGVLPDRSGGRRADGAVLSDIHIWAEHRTRRLVVFPVGDRDQDDARPAGLGRPGDICGGDPETEMGTRSGFSANSGAVLSGRGDGIGDEHWGTAPVAVLRVFVRAGRRRSCGAGGIEPQVVRRVLPSAGGARGFVARGVSQCHGLRERSMGRAGERA